MLLVIHGLLRSQWKGVVLEPASLRSLAGDDDHDCFKEDHQIEEERIVFDIVEVVLQLFRGILDRGAIVMTDFGPACNTRLGTVADGIERDFPGQLIDEDGRLGRRPIRSCHP